MNLYISTSNEYFIKILAIVLFTMDGLKYIIIIFLLTTVIVWKGNVALIEHKNGQYIGSHFKPNKVSLELS